jgi:hypothetical protein
VATPAKASHAQGQSDKIRRSRVAGSLGAFCLMSNEPETTSSAALFRTGSSRGDGEASIVDKFSSGLDNYDDRSLKPPLSKHSWR